MRPLSLSHWKYPALFLGTLAVVFSAQIVCHFLISDGYWSWKILLGGAFQAALLLGAFLFCAKPSRLLALIFLIETELLICDALKVRYLSTSLIPGDLLLLPEFVSLIHALRPWEQLGFYALLVLIPSTWILAAIAVYKCRRKPALGETIWLLPLFAFAGWLIFSPASYRRAFASVVGDEPILMVGRGETYGRVLSLSLELARIVEELEYRPGAQAVASAQQWFHSLNPQSLHPPAAPLKKRNIYIFLVESFWDPARLLHPVISSGKAVPFLDPEFYRAWLENGSSLMFSPIYGSGTANTEFELLCGIPAATASEGIVFVEGLSNPLPCLPRILHENGYRSFAFHSNKPGYYNRSKQFPAIGFDRFFSIEDFRLDRMSGPFLADESFIQQSIDMARKNSGGKPFLAYLMTMAGHWPYPWSDGLYERTFHFQNGTKINSDNEMARELNINLYTSKLIAKTLEKLSREDPDALVVVTGDHLPPTAYPLVSLQSAPRGFLSDPIWFETPLLMVNGSERLGQGVFAAFEVGKLLLDSIGIPQEAQAQFQYFGRANGDLLRPIAPGKMFRLRPEGFDLCLSSSSNPSCATPLQWFKQARALGADLSHGEQYSFLHRN